ncbi:DUF4291 domain-containing protein [Vibrio nitrifigilis]|uniref:DUF4291 domain-containing protein n=1 Tax=Vibrio nitrifigilis TaxID=2789781 RepID=A0ABS0GLL6_9VIBR|nr:DUF4291 domain-containing protein [Vibrio nitrifigilis]MBF9003322.1 DUF4291 domain-containing protein [Vibrio nitrifigilis]
MMLEFDNYIKQYRTWPTIGRTIMAQYNENEIVVYQAYNEKIARFAAKNGHFGGDFSFERMTWIKTNFLWMMYRSGWGSKSNQEVTLAISIRRDAFEYMYHNAVSSSFSSANEADLSIWKQKVRESDIRLQWDPDHDPFGSNLKRRAVQIGIRGSTLRKFNSDWITNIEDVSNFVEQQKRNIDNNNISSLILPKERPYVFKFDEKVELLQL